MNTFGSAYEEETDGTRIAIQMETIKELMSDGRERTLAEIESLTGYPQGSISAQLRHLRKARFGSYDIRKRRMDGSGTWLYWMRLPKCQIGLFSGGGKR